MKDTASILKATDKDFVNKSDKLVKFLELYVETGDKKQAWLDAGYAKGGIRSAGNIIRENMRLVEKLIRNRIGSHVPLALNGVLELATGAKQESVRLKALQDILYRAGYDRPVEIVTSEKDVNALDNKELEDELTTLLARANKEAEQTLQ